MLAVSETNPVATPVLQFGCRQAQLSDLDCIRRLRNESRLWLFDRRWLSFGEQSDWYQGLDLCTNHLKIWTVDDEPMGYTLVRLIEREWWFTLVVAAEFRARGFGSEMYRLSASWYKKKLYARIWSYNIPSRNACDSAGWVHLERVDGVDVFRS